MFDTEQKNAVLRLLSLGRVAQACDLWRRTNPSQRARHGWTRVRANRWRYSATPIVADLFGALAEFSGQSREWVRVGDEILTLAAQSIQEFGDFQPPAPAELENGVAGAKLYAARLRIALARLREKGVKNVNR